MNLHYVQPICFACAVIVCACSYTMRWPGWWLVFTMWAWVGAQSLVLGIKDFVELREKEKEE